MNVRHETNKNLIHFYDFCAFGVYTPSHCTQTRDTGLKCTPVDIFGVDIFDWYSVPPYILRICY